MSEPTKTQPGLLKIVGPGLLVAATGVGSGDLATASFAGSQLGTAILWAVLVGAFLKFVLNEGVARWQLATGQTVIEGALLRLGRGVGWLFLPYLLLWSFLVSLALMSGSGVALHAIVPVFEDPSHGKIVFGILASGVGLALVLIGGYRLFEKIMSVCIGLMTVTVAVCAVLVWPDTGEILRGLLVPSIPDAGGAGVGWTVALIGGVGGTVTVLCYGYWIREEGRDGAEELSLCRLDLGVGYVMTAVFGIAMVIIGSTVEIKGGGASLLIDLSDRLEMTLGLTGRWVFLVGALGAMFSSLLGVWQAVPYLFADVWGLFVAKVGDTEDLRVNPVDMQSLPYKAFLLAMTVVPMPFLWMSFREVAKLYAVVGALFIPILAVALLILNGRRAWVGGLTNKPATIVVLLGALAFFGWMGWTKAFG